jgi:transcriptional regulator with XRE-family HTH domain
MDTKDRIKLIMEDQHMTQQVFADFLQQSPATLSSIFNGRTKPTLNVVDAIKAKIPDISIEWLLYGTGDMYITHPTETTDDPSEAPGGSPDLLLNFDEGSPSSQNSHQNVVSAQNIQHGVKNTHPNLHPNSHPNTYSNIYAEYGREEQKNVERTPRRVTEIRVYYDDQTYETFVPAKK